MGYETDEEEEEEEESDEEDQGSDSGQSEDGDSQYAPGDDHQQTPPDPTEIDMDGIEERVVALPVAAGRYEQVAVHSMCIDRCANILASYPDGRVMSQYVCMYAHRSVTICIPIQDVREPITLGYYCAQILTGASVCRVSAQVSDCTWNARRVDLCTSV